MLKLATALLLCPVLGGVALAAAPAAVVTSPTEFSVLRDDVTRPARAGASFLAHHGDCLEAGESPLRIHSSTGSSGLVGAKGRVRMTDGAYSLESGALALSAGSTEAALIPAITVSGLRLETIVVQDPGSTTGSASITEPPSARQLAVAVNEAGDEVVVFHRGVAVRVEDTTLDRQVAVLSGEEAIRLVRDRLGNWTPALNRLVQETELEGQGFGEEGGEEGILAGLPLLFGGGAAGAAAIGVVAIGGVALVAVGASELASTSDNNEGQPPTSPVSPGQEVGNNRFPIPSVPIPEE